MGGGGWAKWVMGIKEDTCNEYWILYVSDDLLISVPEAITVLEFKLKKYIVT